MSSFHIFLSHVGNYANVHYAKSTHNEVWKNYRAQLLSLPTFLGTYNNLSVVESIKQQQNQNVFLNQLPEEPVNNYVMTSGTP